MDDRDGQCVDIGNRYRPLVWIKGAGDLASGIGVRLHHAGFTIVMTEIAAPTTVRRTVAFSQAVYDGTCAVEGATGVLCGSVKHKAERDEFGAPSAGIAAQGVTARRFADRRFTDQDYNADGRGNDVGCADDVFADIAAVLEKKQIPVVVDPKGLTVKCLQPDVIVDAILAKRNTGTLITDAALVIGVGPGFSAGVDCHCVVETQRGHYLGRCIWKGSAIPNTGIPGEVGGYGIERLVRSPCAGVFHGTKAIGDKVEAGQAVGYVEGGGDNTVGDISEGDSTGEGRGVGIVPVTVEIDGILRGILQDGCHVSAGMKAGDVDPRCEREHCFTVSDKARAVGGGVLEAIMAFLQGDHRDTGQ